MPKQPQAALDSIYAFPPNRDTLGGTAYLIVENSVSPGAETLAENPSKHSLENPLEHRPENILVDCPPWTEETAAFLHDRGGVHWWVLTHRASFGKLETIRQLQAAFGCTILVQEQEAYLLPRIPLRSFGDRLDFGADLGSAWGDRARLIWTPGHSPGSACLWVDRHGGVLFSGRHLLPLPSGDLVPQKTAKTFHWYRQLASVDRLRQEFSPETLATICPGANLGFLRGVFRLDRGFDRLVGLDLVAARTHPTVLIADEAGAEDPEL